MSGNDRIDGTSQTLEGLKEDLQREIGTPARWEMLFTKEGNLIEGGSLRHSGTLLVDNPTIADAGKPKSAFVRYDATIPAVHDWDVLQAFARHGCSHLVPRFHVAGERSQYLLDPRAP